MALNYYSPYVSGLTEAARMVAEALADSGQSVLVVTCQHRSDLPLRETINGVDVRRSRVMARLGKGLISPSFLLAAIRWGRRAKVVNLHLPMLESGVVALLSGRARRVVTYQCDIALPAGPLNWLQTRIMDLSSVLAFAAADVIVPSSADYGRHSRLRRWMPDRKLMPISPPTRLRQGGTPVYRSGDGIHVGFLGRIVEEKGLEYLVDGFRALPDPGARLLIAGDFENIAGGSIVGKVRRHIGDDDRVRLLGFLTDAELADFYASIDVFALPSVNSFEAFGIVQVEAMRLGVAALASDLPGVRTPVEETGFGVVIQRASSAAVTTGLQGLVASPPDKEHGAEATSARYSLDRTIADYRAAFGLDG